MNFSIPGQLGSRYTVVPLPNGRGHAASASRASSKTQSVWQTLNSNGNAARVAGGGAGGGGPPIHDRGVDVLLAIVDKVSGAAEPTAGFGRQPARGAEAVVGGEAEPTAVVTRDVVARIVTVRRNLAVASSRLNDVEAGKQRRGRGAHLVGVVVPKASLKKVNLATGRG
eukprot:SAG11_NODE_1356_length_5123_cov_2.002787_3_plen_169_part_00